MGAPTHNPDTCGTKRYFEIKCHYCKSYVFFYECTCGSKVFFEDDGPPWTKHSCSKIIMLIRNLKKMGYKNEKILEMIIDRGKESGKEIPEGMRELIQDELSQMSLF